MGGASLATLYTARWGLCDTQTAVRSPVYTFDKLYTPYKIQGMIIQDKYYYRYIGGMLLNWIWIWIDKLPIILSNNNAG